LSDHLANKNIDYLIIQSEKHDTNKTPINFVKIAVKTEFQSLFHIQLISIIIEMKIQGEQVYELWVKCDEQWCNPQSKKIFINDEEKILKGYVQSINVYFIFNCKLIQKIKEIQLNQSNKYLNSSSNQSQIESSKGKLKQRPASSQHFSSMKINDQTSNNFSKSLNRQNLNNSQFSSQPNSWMGHSCLSNNHQTNTIRTAHTNIPTYNFNNNIYKNRSVIHYNY
jgi:hypothetical protein